MNNNDAYLNTVRRNLKEQKIVARKEAYLKKQKNQKKRGFLSQNVELRQFLDLPDGFQEAVLMFLFLMIPYNIGLIGLFFTGINMELYEYTSATGFLLAWIIGYEFTAAFIIVSILYQAITYREVAV